MSTTRFNPPYPKLEDADGDGHVVPGENDISRDQKRTLGSYLASVTRARAPRDEVVEFAGSIPERANTFPVAEGEIRTKGFTDLVGERIADTFEYSSSGIFDGRESGDLDDLITKGALGEGNNPTVRPNTLGHYMLNRPAAAGAAAEIVDRSNSASPARPNFPDQDTTRASSRATVTDTLGEEGLSSSYDPRAKRISVEDIRNSTLDMLLAATGKNKGHRNTAAYEGSLLKAGIEPSTVQAGIARVDVNDMRPAKYVPIRDMNSTTRRMSGEPGSTDAVITTDGLGEDRYNNRSSGASNSPFEPFSSPLSGVSTFGVVSLAIFASVAAVSAVVLGFQKLSNLAGGGTLTPIRVMTGSFLSPAPLINRSDEVLDLALGKYELENKATPTFPGNLFNLVSEGLQAIGVPDFYNPISGRNYFECAMLGYIAFLGANPDDDADLRDNVSFLTITAQFIKRSGILLLLKQQRGYYETIFRNISRNINALISSTRADPATFLSTGGIESLFSAGIVDIVQIFAKTGDMLYLRYDASKNFKLGEVVDTSFAQVGMFGLLKSTDAGPSKSDFSSYKKFAASRNRFQRTSDGSRSTSLDGAEIPALRLLPETYHDLILEGTTTVGNMLWNSGYAKQQPATKNRFTEEQVAEIEDLLESEYMPFYFQDLRTNEIVSFNAFLDDVTDGFQAEYSSISGYGRIEDAKIYKGTKRSLSVKFHLFAANPDDFDTMWWQINKLTTMVYPQWSRGRELQIVQGNNLNNAVSKKFPFIQPFSQIPTATPVVRVRVGDLIRSNYSRFNLKRLFGFKDSDIGLEQAAAGGKFSTGTEAVSTTTVTTIAPTPSSAAVPPRSIPLKLRADVELTIFARVGPETIKAGTVLTPVGRDKYSFTYLGASDDDRHLGKTVTVRKSLVTTIGGGRTAGSAAVAGSGGSTATETTITAAATISQDGDAMTAGTFYNPDKNAIIRSFESTMGKGLPAVCTSLKFGWMDAPWGAGEDGPGYRAPRYCTVDMQFDVMHDIAPGLDADGFNRAPIYPVGETIPLLVEGGEPNPYGRGTKSSQDTRTEYNSAISKK